MLLQVTKVVIVIIPTEHTTPTKEATGTNQRLVSKCTAQQGQEKYFKYNARLLQSIVERLLWHLGQ